MGARRPEELTRVPPTRCVKCNAPIDAVGYHDPHERKPPPPRPGDAIACRVCGAVATIDAAGFIRGFTPAEFFRLINDPDAMRDLVRNVRAVELVRITEVSAAT
jgi:hypothetical protein